jgi:hypothetical protein
MLETLQQSGKILGHALSQACQSQGPAGQVDHLSLSAKTHATFCPPAVSQPH